MKPVDVALVTALAAAPVAALASGSAAEEPGWSRGNYSRLSFAPDGRSFNFTYGHTGSTFVSVACIHVFRYNRARRC